MNHSVSQSVSQPFGQLASHSLAILSLYKPFSTGNLHSLAMDRVVLFAHLVILYTEVCVNNDLSQSAGRSVGRWVSQ